VLAAFATFAGQAAVVYKWTDSDGVVHYSDQPVPGAEKIFTGSNPTAGLSTGAARSGSGSSAAKKPLPGLGYDQFAITSPTPDQSFFGDESIGAHLALDPNLKPGQTITWHLNGQDLSDQAPTATQITLPRLDRGTYAIAATVTDPSTGESRSTDSVSFFVRQPSALSPLHQKP
jgi:Domain of unknown function (DUF4124)